MHLGIVAVVRRSKMTHTLLQTLVSNMVQPPTLIVIAEPSMARHAIHGGGALGYFDGLGCMLRRMESAGLPALLVCDNPCAGASACQIADEHIVKVSFQSTRLADQYIEALITGIQSRPNAGGWLALPCAMPMIQASTLQAVAQALKHKPVAFAEYHQQAGYPMGFSSELYSELMQVRSFRELERIMARYPSHRVEVDDPGVLMVPEALRHHGTALDPRFMVSPRGPAPHRDGMG
jgi:molybdenum cofactor cytidylyltransferase